MPASLTRPSRDSATLVLDSWPVMEWLWKHEPTATHFRDLLEQAEQGKVQLLMSTINVGEVYYLSAKDSSVDRSVQVLANIRRLPIEVIHPVENGVFAAARIKGKYGISYADAFVAALAMQLDVPVLTGDPDFLKLEADGLLTVEWVGQ